MRIGVRAHDFGRLPAEVLAARIAGAGLTCVQLTLPEAIEGLDGGPGRLNPGMAGYIGETFRRHGLQVAVLSCYINPIHPDPEERRRQVGLFKEHVRFVRDFGCSIVATETGSLNPDFSFHPQNHGEEAFRTMLASVGEMVEEAERFGVFVGIEGVAAFVASDPRRIRRLLDTIGSSHVQIVFDPVNLLTVDNHTRLDGIIEESFALFGDRIGAVHAKDFVVENGRIRSVQLGKGRMNYPLLVRLLEARKPFINVIMEDTEVETIETGLRYLQGLQAAPESRRAD